MNNHEQYVTYILPRFSSLFAPRASKGSLAQSTVGRISVRKGQESPSGLLREISLCPSPEVIFTGSAMVTRDGLSRKNVSSLHKRCAQRASISRHTNFATRDYKTPLNHGTREWRHTFFTL